jgi:peptide/nickel transport system permease protein
VVRFLTRRILFYLVTLWAAVTLNFAIPRLMPGDPVQAVLSRFKGQVSPHATQAFTKLFGLNGGSTLPQYWTYLSDLLHEILASPSATIRAPPVHIPRPGRLIRWRAPNP